MWKEAVVGYFEVMSWYLPGWTVKNYEKPQSG
jgi:hypothetical protein